MEHKLIHGGEQYLPFARNRIKALRAAGLNHASQQFEMGDASVKVRIVGDQEYIELAGGVIEILSGCVKNGELIKVLPPPDSPPDTLPPCTLRSYKPTQQALEFPLKKSKAKTPRMFRDEPRLGVWAHADLMLGGSQYDKLCSSMYSGKMAKVVQLILGYGKSKSSLLTPAQKTDGVQVRYDYRWARCHGVVTATDGKPWLLEISQDRGVLAMLLPLFKGTQALKSSNQCVLKETVKLLGGLPTGGVFPSGEKLTAAIAEGSVLQLKTAAEMSGFFTKSKYSSALGWSFNDSGSEAHNTCHYTVVGIVTGCHYKLALAIGAVQKDRTPGQPLATATAELTLVSEGPIKIQSGRLAFNFYEPLTDSFIMPGTLDPNYAPEQTLTTIMACHINGALELVQWGHMPVLPANINTPIDPIIEASPYQVQYAYPSSVNRFLSTTSYPSKGQRNVLTRNKSAALTHSAAAYSYSDSTGLLKQAGRNYAITALENNDKAPLQTGLWANGARDSYVLYHGLHETTDSTGLTYHRALYKGTYRYDAVQSGSDRIVTEVYLPENEAIDNPAAGTFFSGGTYSEADFQAQKDALVASSSFLPTLESPSLVSTTLTNPEAVEVVLASGEAKKTLLADVADPVASRTAWGAPGALSSHRFAVRYSSFGAAPQTTYTPDILVSTVKLDGSELASEVTPSTDTFSFVGYIE